MPPSSGTHGRTRNSFAYTDTGVNVVPPTLPESVAVPRDAVAPPALVFPPHAPSAIAPTNATDRTTPGPLARFIPGTYRERAPASARGASPKLTTPRLAVPPRRVYSFRRS